MFCVHGDSITGLAITEPSGSESKVMSGQRLSIKCSAAAGTVLKWNLDDQAVQANEVGGFIITPADLGDQSVSILSKDVATLQDTGTYTCFNADDADEADNIEITVTESGSRDITVTESGSIEITVAESDNIEIITFTESDSRDITVTESGSREISH